MRTALGLNALDPGSPNLPEPLFTIVPGLDAPEVRVQSLPVGPARWGETSLLPFPLIAVGEATLRRYSPIQGPLSATGGPVMDVRLGQVPNDRAASAFRVTRASYGTFTDEILLRRPIGAFLFDGAYGTTKSGGFDLWGPQVGETINLRAGHRMARGYGIFSYDDGHHREHLLTTKRGTWDRRALGYTWSRPDSATGGGIEASLEWTHLEAGWWTARGLTRRDSRSLFGHGLARRAVSGGIGSIAVEAEYGRIRYDRRDVAHLLLHDLDFGGAVGWEKRSGVWDHRISAGIARFAPLAPGPIFSAESEVAIGGGSLLFYASRAVRNRTLPRLTTDGEAWVRQGIDLVAERSGERPEALWRGAIEGRKSLSRRVKGGVGADLLLDASGLALSDSEIVLLGTDQQDAIPPSALRRNRSYASPWGSAAITLPFGFRVAGRGLATVAEAGTKAGLGLPDARADGEIGWRGALFKDDLHLDLSLIGHVRSSAATPYGELGSLATADCEIRGRIDTASFFFVLANLTDELVPAFGWDGSLSVGPRRNYRAGLRWSFTD